MSLTATSYFKFTSPVVAVLGGDEIQFSLYNKKQNKNKKWILSN